MSEALHRLIVANQAAAAEQHWQLSELGARHFDVALIRSIVALQKQHYLPVTGVADRILIHAIRGDAALRAFAPLSRACDAALARQGTGGPSLSPGTRLLLDAAGYVASADALDGCPEVVGPAGIRSASGTPGNRLQFVGDEGLPGRVADFVASQPGRVVWIDASAVRSFDDASGRCLERAVATVRGLDGAGVWVLVGPWPEGIIGNEAVRRALQAADAVCPVANLRHDPEGTVAAIHARWRIASGVPSCRLLLVGRVTRDTSRLSMLRYRRWLLDRGYRHAAVQLDGPPFEALLHAAFGPLPDMLSNVVLSGVDHPDYRSLRRLEAEAKIAADPRRPGIRKRRRAAKKRRLARERRKQLLAGVVEG